MSNLYVSTEGLLCINVAGTEFKVTAVSDCEDGIRFKVEFLKFNAGNRTSNQ